MKVLVLGKTGQLARALATEAAAARQDPGARAETSHDTDWIFAGRDRADLEVPGAAAAVIAAERPDAVINAAAWTAVDLAESEPQRAHRVNADAVAEIAGACADAGAMLVHVSTDYVFDGSPGRAWREDDPTGPLGVYGATKLAGERAALNANPKTVILRTSWVYAPWGKNFVRTMIGLAGRDRLNVVDDQTGCPTSALDLARACRTVVDIMEGAPSEDPRWGVYHYAASDSATWCRFAREILRASESRGLIAKAPAVEGIPTSAYPTPAKRPANSVLDTGKFAATFGLEPRRWQDALAETLDLMGAKEDA